MTSVLGLTVPDSRIGRVLERLEMRVERDSDGWRVTPSRVSIRHNDRRRPDRGGSEGWSATTRFRPPGTMRERLGRATESAVTPGAHRRSARRARLLRSDQLQLRGRRPRGGREPGRHAGPPGKSRPPERHGGFAAFVGRDSCNAARQNLAHQRGGFKLFELGPQSRGRRAGRPQTAVLAGLAVGTRGPALRRGRGRTSTLRRQRRRGVVADLTGRAAEFRFEAATHPGR